MIKNLPALRLVISLSFFLALLSPSAFAQFTTGNVVVLQIGDGSAALTAGASPLFLKEYNVTTSLQTSAVTTVSIPTSGPARLTVGGTATSEGQITLSSDTSRIVIAGYDTSSSGTTAPNTYAASLVNRVIDTVANSGIVGRATSSNSVFSANAIRSAARNNGENYWAAGANSGTYYFGTSSTPGAIQTVVTNTRVIIPLNGNLYFSTGSGTLGIYKISGQPVLASTATSLIPTGTGSSPYAFSINASETIAYIADDRTTSASVGGVYKWTLNGGVWTVADTLKTGTAIGARGIAVDWSGIYPSVYATTTDNKLIRWNDSSNASHIFTVLAAAPTNTIFRSVVFAPKAPCINPALSPTVTNYTCAGNGSISISLTSGSTPTSYSWTGPGTYTAATQNITNLQPGSYTVVATTAGGCSATLTTSVANNATATATITAQGTTTFCAGGSVILKANTGTGYTYVWKNGASVIPGAVDSMYTATTAGSYSVVVTSGVNCTATSSALTVTVNPLPSAAVTTAGSTTFCQGGSVMITAPSASGNTYVWKLNGATISTATGNTYLANASGTYWVIVTNSNSCKDSSATTVTVNPLPSTIVTPSGSTTFCTGGSVQLCAASTTGVVYQWKTATGNISGATSSCYTASTSGNYKVIITNSLTGCTDSSSGTTVSANSGPAATITPAGPVAICQGTTVVLHTNNSTGLTYQWKLNGANITVGGGDSTYAVSAAGSYSVVVSAGVGCSSTSLPVVVSINPKPAITATTTNALCFGTCTGSATLTASGAMSPYTYAVGTGAYNAAATFNGLCNGIYTFHAKDANGCVKDTVMNINQPGLLVASANITVPVLCGGTGSITVSGSGGTPAYQYKHGVNGTYSSNAVFSGVPAGTDTFYVMDANNCTASAIITITATNPPSANITPAGTLAICPGSSTVLHTNNASGLTYQWQLNGTSVAAGGSDSTYTASIAGSYTVVVSAGVGCTSTSSPVIITLRAAPTPVVTYFAGLLSTNAYASYQWRRNGTPISGATSQSYVPGTSGNYTVSVIDAFGCSGTSASILVPNLGIGSPASNTALAVYPNPTSGLINIISSGMVNVTVRDIQGREIMHQQNTCTVNISQLSDGIYILNVWDKVGNLIRNIRITKSAQ